MYKTREAAEQAVIELPGKELEGFAGRKVNVRGISLAQYASHSMHAFSCCLSCCSSSIMCYTCHMRTLLDMLWAG